MKNNIKNYTDAEKRFRIKTELDFSYSDVLKFLEAYNEYCEIVLDDEALDVDELINEKYEVGIMYTTDEDSDDELQLSYNLKSGSYKYYVNGELITEEKCHVEEAINDLKFNDFDMFYQAMRDERRNEYEK